MFKTVGVEYVIFSSISMALHNVGRSTTNIELYLRNTEDKLLKFVDVLLKVCIKNSNKIIYNSNIVQSKFHYI